MAYKVLANFRGAKDFRAGDIVTDADLVGFTDYYLSNGTIEIDESQPQDVTVNPDLVEPKTDSTDPIVDLVEPKTKTK